MKGKGKAKPGMKKMPMNMMKGMGAKKPKK